MPMRSAHMLSIPRRAARLCLTGVQLSQAYVSHRRTALIGMSLMGVQLSQAHISHRRVALTGMRLSQACSSRRCSGPL
jgi:uncharacterized protein YjbI with pentapeptide repeats